MLIINLILIPSYWTFKPKTAAKLRKLVNPTKQLPIKVSNNNKYNKELTLVINIMEIKVAINHEINRHIIDIMRICI